MACFAPLKAYRTRDRNPETGRYSIVFHFKEGYVDLHKQIPCGSCTGCKLAKAQEWAIRCIHEAQMHEENCFLTLTYNNENLPEHGNLIKSDHQKFLKRFRKKILNDYGKKIRFYHCGEYGPKLGRPHFHTLIFGFDFPDKVFLKITKSGEKIYTSEILSELWPLGWSSIGSVTFQSAGYVARYTLEKKNGDLAEAHYSKQDPQTGETIRLNPEYTTMSRAGGIGTSWFEKYGFTDVYPGDFILYKNKKIPPPKFYDNKLFTLNRDLWNQLKDDRIDSGRKHQKNNTPARLRIRAKIQNLKALRLAREIE